MFWASEKGVTAKIAKYAEDQGGERIACINPVGLCDPWAIFAFFTATFVLGAL
jgi:hypothetical protein